MRHLLGFILVVTASAAVAGCDEDDRAREATGAASFDVIQFFRPERPYGKEGSAAGVIVKRGGKMIQTIGPIRSDPDSSTQALGSVPLQPGRYRARAFQLGCDRSCPDRLPPTQRIRRLPLSCTQSLEVGAQTDGAFVLVHPDRTRCRIEPTEGAPAIECSDRPPLLEEVIDSYPAIDWDPPSRVCVVELGAGRILDVVFNGAWGSLRRDEVGVVEEPADAAGS